MTEAERSPPSVRSSLAKRNEKQIAKGGEDGEETIPMGVEMIAALKKTFMRALPEEMQRLIIALKNRSVYLGSSPLTYKQDGLATEHNADFMKDEAFMKSYNLGKNTGSWRKSEIHWRAYVACWAANKAKHLEGDFVECGVYRGGLARTVMHYVDFKKLPKKFYLLDTFCGLVEECLSDDEQKRGFRELGRRYDDCYEFVRDLFKEFGNVVIIRGTVPDTLPLVEARKVSYLSIDMNCAAPEIAAAEFFWDKLVSGAVMVLDDYGWANHIAQKRSFDEFAFRKGVQVLPLPTGQGLILKP